MALARKNSNRNRNINSNISHSDSKSSDGSNYVFGKPYSEHHLIHQNLVDETSIDFDLIYMPRCVELVFGSGGGNIISSSGSSGGGIMYLHCGGTEGNESQIKRYKRAGVI